ncbi:type VII secretion target [Rhodococcus erythropolis]|uniref:type VII secretion target n=1 Tax=Rhodococcus erythropolis TaxID=1833 RepID=UPI003D0ADBDB
MTNLDLDTESIAEFATRLGTVADNVAQARQDAAGGDHLALSAVLGLIGGDFVDVASRAQQAHIDDIDRLSAVISSVQSANRDAHAVYLDSEESVRTTLAEAARS